MGAIVREYDNVRRQLTEVIGAALVVLDQPGLPAGGRTTILPVQALRQNFPAAASPVERDRLGTAANLGLRAHGRQHG